MSVDWIEIVKAGPAMVNHHYRNNVVAGEMTPEVLMNLRFMPQALTPADRLTDIHSARPWF
jgi:hypothetical protein